MHTFEITYTQSVTLLLETTKECAEVIASHNYVLNDACSEPFNDLATLAQAVPEGRGFHFHASATTPLSDLSGAVHFGLCVQSR